VSTTPGAKQTGKASSVKEEKRSDKQHETTSHRRHTIERDEDEFDTEESFIEDEVNFDLLNKDGYESKTSEDETDLIIDDYDLIESNDNAPAPNPTPTPGAGNAPCVIDSHAKKARFSEIDSRQLSWYTQQDLRDRYKISFAFVLMKCLKWLALCIATWAGYIYWHGFESILVPQSFTQHLQLIGVRMTLAVLLFMLLYWEMYRRMLEVRIVGFRLIVTQGVLWKVRGSMAIVPIMQITVKQSGLDLLFNIYRVVMWVPGNSEEDDMLTIPGLSHSSAYDLHNFMTIELNRQVFLSGSALESEDQMRLQEAMAGEGY
jgi:hypothetical protein